MVTADVAAIEPSTSSVPLLTVVEPEYELLLVSTKLPEPLFIRLTFPVPVPTYLSRITPWNVQLAVLLTVRVLSVFKPLLSAMPSIADQTSPLMPAKVCEWPLSSRCE